MKTNWIQIGSNYRLSEITQQRDKLPIGVYVVTVDPRTGELYLNLSKPGFEFGYKLYGIEQGYVDRVVKTYKNTKGNLGMIMNGVKGTGKTVTGELIANTLQLPIILITHKFEGISEFINSIHDDVVIFFDEYEKVYNNYNDDILTVMDGVLNNGFRRVFILTTNEIRVNYNLLQRPSRIRYVKTFDDLDLSTIMEIVDDILIHKELRDEVIKFVSTLEIITIDIVKSLIEEVNIHHESPIAFKNIFNTKSIENMFNVYEIIKGNSGEKDTTKLVWKEVSITPLKISHKNVGDYFKINNAHLGEIKLVVDETDIFVEMDDEDDDDKVVTKHYFLERVDKTHRAFTSYNPSAY